MDPPLTSTRQITGFVHQATTQKQQLSGIKTSVLSAGDRIGRAVGDVFVHLRIDDGLDIAYVRHYRRIFYRGYPTAAADDSESKQDTVASPELILHVTTYRKQRTRTGSAFMFFRSYKQPICLLAPTVGIAQPV
ncbi:hypothetical protein ZWY2020_000637 [Hordeum vulgare]|nr:hypothetical protein ZWY2020_000637 [Hordeum vulgare]